MTLQQPSRLSDASRRLKIQPTLARRGSELASAANQLELLEGLQLGGHAAGDFGRELERAGLPVLRAGNIEVLQLNLGRVCNQTCNHCHVDAGPDRTESMSRETAELCLRVLAESDIPAVDITGGAPEINPSFRTLVERSRALGRRVMDRCNLTVLCAQRYADLPRFLADQRVEVICSLPHYRKLLTDRQRGEGVWEASIEGLQRLNAVGYGDGRSGLELTLVTNPAGAFAPAGQASLEDEWKRELSRLGIRFDHLIAICNMPISRYLEWLEERGQTRAYLQRLVDAFNPAAVAGLMCRSTLSVGWDGRLYDCDFNQMLELELEAPAPRHLADFDPARLEGRPIRTARHCFGCTAGAGSSCSGTTT